MLPRIKNILVNTVLVSAGFFLAVVMGEVMLRLILPRIEPQTVTVADADPVLHPDLVLDHVIVPNSDGGQNDARGFRNDAAMEYTDVVTLGDSHKIGRA